MNTLHHRAYAVAVTYPNGTQMLMSRTGRWVPPNTRGVMAWSTRENAEHGIAMWCPSTPGARVVKLETTEVTR